MGGTRVSRAAAVTAHRPRTETHRAQATAGEASIRTFPAALITTGVSSGIWGRGVRRLLPLLAALSIGCGDSLGPGPGPTPPGTPAPTATAPTTGACGGLELNPVNRHYFRDVASGRPVLIIGYRNLTPGFARLVPTAPPGQPQPPGAGTRTPDPRFTDYVIDDMTGQPGPFNFPSYKRHYLAVFQLGAGNDPTLDPMYDNGNGTNAPPNFFAWPWLRAQGGDSACYRSFGDPKGTRYDVGGNGRCPAAWNSAYLDRLSAAVGRASSSCITSEIKLFDKSMLQNQWRVAPWAADNSSNGIELPGCADPGSWPWFFYLQQPAPNLQVSQQCYVDKIVDLTKGANVVYEIENENVMPGTQPWARMWAQRIKERASRLVSYSSQAEENRAAALADPSIDIVNLHFGSPLEHDWGQPRDFITASWTVGVSNVNGAAGSGKPVNVDEFGKCSGRGTTPTYDTLRKMAWAIVASGGHFHIEDTCDPLIPLPDEDPPPVDSKPREVVENVRRFVEDSGLPDGGWNFVMSRPFPAPPVPGAPMPPQVPGRFCMGPDPAIFQATQAPGPRDYLCYYDGSDASVVKTIQGIEGPAAYSARWWDPRNGGFAGPSTELGCVSGQAVTLSAPDAGDWVLLLRSTGGC